METIFQYRLACPWCAKGEVLSNTSEKVIISVQCAVQYQREGRHIRTVLSLQARILG